jgi:hypothetical protein
MAAEIRTVLEVDVDRTRGIIERVVGAVDGERSIEAASALHSVLCDVLANCAVDLPSALANIDSLANNAKQMLRERLGN